jgi:hypothetical protein
MDYTSIKVGQLPTGEISGGNFIPHEVAGILKKATITDLAAFIGANDAVGFRAVSVQNGGTLPATDTQEFILVGPGTYNNVGGGSTITVTEELNALVSNGTYWFVGVEIPIDAPPGNAIWGQIIGTLSNQTDLKNILDLKADLVDGKVPASQLPSYVDDIIEVANYAALPTTGETGKIYLTLDNNKIYRWSGSIYIEIAAENAVWGQIVGTLSNQTDLQSALNAKVPYTGATANVDLGTHTLSSKNLVVNHASGSGVAAQITKGGNGEALTVVKSSGTGNAASITGGVTLLSELHLNTDLADAYIASAATWNAKQNALNGTGFVKISGTTISYDNSTYALDSAVVTLATDQTISGQKTFLNNVNIDAGINLDDAFGLFWKTNVGAIETALAGIGQSSSGLNFFTGSSLSTPKMVINSSGSVGIGTTSPIGNVGSTAMQIVGADYPVFTVSSSNQSIDARLGIGFGNASVGTLTNHPFYVISNNAVSTTFSTNGNVGINTTSPATKLHVRGNVVSNRGVLCVADSSGSGADSYPVITLYDSSDSQRADIGMFANDFKLTNYANGNLLLSTNNTERMRITSGGVVQIGGTPTPFLTSKLFISRGDQYGLHINVVTGTVSMIASDDNMTLGTSGSERMRITSGGNVLIGTTSGTGKLNVSQSGVEWSSIYNHTNATTQYYFLFQYNGTSIGSIIGNNTSTSYNTTSDYRLKQDLKPINGLDLVSQIKVYDYEWKSDETRAYGVLAHELQEVIPQAVNGEKDAEQMQGVDYSKLVPILVQAIQELKAEIEILKNK